MFGEFAFSEAPFATTAELGTVFPSIAPDVIYFNGTILAYPLSVNKVAEFNMSLNKINQHSLKLNKLATFSTER